MIGTIFPEVISGMMSAEKVGANLKAFDLGMELVVEKS